MLRTPSRETAGILALGSVLIAVLLVGGWEFVSSVTKVAETEQRQDTIFIATTTASAFEPDEVKLARARDQSAMEQVQRELIRLDQTLAGVKSVDLLERNNGIFHVLVSSDDVPLGIHQPLSFPGMNQALDRVFDSGSPEVVGPYGSGPDARVSAIAPIFDLNDKKVEAVVAYEFSAEDWQRDVRRFAGFAIAIVVLVGGLIGFFVTGLLVQRRHQKRVARLNTSLEREVAELALSNQIVENSTTIVFRAEPETLAFTYISHNIERYGYRSDALLNMPNRWRALFHPDDLPLIVDDVQQMTKGKIERTRREVRLHKGDGAWVWFDIQLSAVRDEEGRLVAFEGLLFDISETKKAEAHIRYLANHDTLTGLANRAAFVTRLQTAFAEAKRGGPGFAVLYMDIDHFKDINDTFGEADGDLFLKTVAARLAGILRETDAVGRFSIARLGGDEFAILQYNASDPSDAAALAQRLNRMLALPFAIKGYEIHTTVSIGVSLYDKSVKEPNDMLSQADLALYRAKDGGRNQFHFHSNELDTKVRERVTIAEELHAALQNHELELYYQPQVAIPSGRIIGVEALMRWNHPRRGMISPAVFIPIAEKSGLIVAMGRWAIEEACSQMQRWRAGGIEPSSMGVNVSAIQIRNSPEFDQEVGEVLRRTGTNPEALELELTESILMETTETHNEILHRLRKMGVRIAIDDFGTGYSSLQYLQSYPITRIKIAQQFMREAADFPNDAAIVRATIGLAQGLKIDLIAEGVETQAQTTFLRAAGCPAVQGFYFSCPVDAKHATALLRQKKFNYVQRTAPTLLQHAMQ